MSDRSVVHWSKDYVEHLRAVHFSLIAVCASLIVLIDNSVDYDAKKAFHQVQDIQALESDWSPDWVFAQLQAQSSVGGTCQYSSSEHSDLIEVTSGKPQLLEGTLVPPPKGRSATFNLQLPKPSWFQPGTFGAGKSGVMKSLAVLPTTVSEFRIWWDDLRVLTPVIYRPISLCPQGLVLGSKDSNHAVQYASVLENDQGLRDAKLDRVVIPIAAPIPAADHLQWAYVAALADGTAYFPFSTFEKVEITQRAIEQQFPYLQE
jgi:hypothetical protein